MRSGHDKFDGYNFSIDHLGCADDGTYAIPISHTFTANRLPRASASKPLNIAGGAGKFPGLKKRNRVQPLVPHLPNMQQYSMVTKRSILLKMTDINRGRIRLWYFLDVDRTEMIEYKYGYGKNT